MKATRLLAIALLTAVALAGCITNYQYQARGQIATSNGPQSAVLYWHKDEGRLWYGKKYEQADTSLTLRICKQLPKPFTLGDEKHLVLLGRNGDLLAAAVSDGGAVTPLVNPQPASADSACGLVLLDGAPTDTARLQTGAQPVVAFLCNNVARPDRYPPVGGYAFGAVSRHETDKNRTAPDPCQ